MPGWRWGVRQQRAEPVGPRDALRCLPSAKPEYAAAARYAIPSKSKLELQITRQLAATMRKMKTEWRVDAEQINDPSR